MPPSEAKSRANAKWDAENMGRVTLSLRKALIKQIQEAADREGITRDRWLKNTIKEKLMTTEANQLPPRWHHGTNNWRQWPDDVFASQKSIGDPMDKFCLGDRMVGWESGSHTKSSLRGSLSNDWHGGPDFGYDLKTAIEWLQEADHKELGPYLWGGEIPESQESDGDLDAT